MKTLILIIDGIRCEFEAGKLTFNKPFVYLTNEPFMNWFKRNRDEIEHYKDLTASKAPLFIPSNSLRFGHLGNGVTVYTTALEENNDYLTIAHISPRRVVKYYHQVDKNTRAKIESFAAHENMTISATQDQKVFIN